MGGRFDRRLSLIEAALERIDRASRAREAWLEGAIRELAVRVEALSRLEERLAEKRTARTA